MPSFTPSPKRQSLIVWILFAVGVLVSLLLIRTIARKMVGGVPSRTLSVSSRQDFFGSGVMPYAKDQIPEMGYAPSPMPPITKGGSAMLDLDGKKPVQRVIKNSQLSLRVTDAPKTVEDIRTLVTNRNGLVESSSISDAGSGPRTAWMTIRVPIADFDAIILEVKKFATLVLNDTVNGQDVTMEFVDLEADLRNAKAEEQSYLEILKRAGSIEDVLAVTQRLADVRGRIERIEGRKRYLENQTDLATISVSLTEDTRVTVPSRTWRPLEVLKASLRELVDGLQELINFLIRLIVGVLGLLLPILLIATLFLWLGWKVIKNVIKRVRK